MLNDFNGAKKVYIACGYTDLRRGIDGLSNIVEQQFQLVLYDHQPNRKADNAESFLESFKGYLHTDGYKGYRGIDGVTVVGCWAHARRRFCEALEVIPEAQRKGTVAETALVYCGKLYAVEKKIKYMSFEERLKERQEHSKQLLDAFFAWAKTLSGIAPKSKLGKAVYFLLERNIIYADTLRTAD